jgi:hypothetical protein
VCECLPEYQGNPYEGCRPECLVSSDCPMNKACIRNKCQDPCPGTCGVGAICTVSNHIPICSCPPGTTGDAFRICNYVPIKGWSSIILNIYTQLYDVVDRAPDFGPRGPRFEIRARRIFHDLRKVSDNEY